MMHTNKIDISEPVSPLECHAREAPSGVSRRECDYFGYEACIHIFVFVFFHGELISNPRLYMHFSIYNFTRV